MERSVEWTLVHAFAARMAANDTVVVIGVNTEQGLALIANMPGEAAVAAGQRGPRIRFSTVRLGDLTPVSWH